jgi:uncharacterized protein
VPPFTLETAVEKFAWLKMDGTVEPSKRSRLLSIATGGTAQSSSREAFIGFLTRKWQCGFRENRMAVRFADERHDDSGN